MSEYCTLDATPESMAGRMCSGDSVLDSSFYLSFTRCSEGLDIYVKSELIGHCLALLTKISNTPSNGVQYNPIYQAIDSSKCYYNSVLKNTLKQFDSPLNHYIEYGSIHGHDCSSLDKIQSILDEDNSNPFERSHAKEHLLTGRHTSHTTIDKQKTKDRDDGNCYYKTLHNSLLFRDHVMKYNYKLNMSFMFSDDISDGYTFRIYDLIPDIAYSDIRNTYWYSMKIITERLNAIIYRHNNLRGDTI